MKLERSIRENTKHILSCTKSEYNFFVSAHFYLYLNFNVLSVFEKYDTFTMWHYL